LVYIVLRGKTSVSVYSINVTEKQITIIFYSSAEPPTTTI